MSGNYSLNDDGDGGKLFSSVPLAHSNKRRGWDGEHLELNRQQPTEHLASHAAINLGQFRNEQIGVGYQAKHVIRQRQVPNASIFINDMVLPLDTTANNATHKKRKHEELGKVGSQSKSSKIKREYLKCKELRQFRKELASIDSST